MPKFTLHSQLAADTIELGDLPVSKVLLMDDSQYPWLILVPRRHQIQELYQLEKADAEQVQLESLIVSELMMQHFDGDKLNVATLGNLVPQLHIHHIVRFRNDAAWPKPVWGEVKPIVYETSNLDSVASSLRALFSSHTKDFSPLL